MRAIPAAIAAARAERAGIISHHLVWVRAKDREAGAASPIGFWTGDDHREFTVGGASRLYYGAGGLLALDQIVQGVGMDVRQHQVSLSGIAPEVEVAIRGYEVRLAPCEINPSGRVFDRDRGAAGRAGDGRGWRGRCRDHYHPADRWRGDRGHTRAVQCRAADATAGDQAVGREPARPRAE